MSLAFANYYRLKNTEANYLITWKRLVLKAMMVVQRIIDFQYQYQYIGGIDLDIDIDSGFWKILILVLILVLKNIDIDVYLDIDFSVKKVLISILILKTKIWEILILILFENLILSRVCLWTCTQFYTPKGLILSYIWAKRFRPATARYPAHFSQTNNNNGHRSLEKLNCPHSSLCYPRFSIKKVTNWLQLVRNRIMAGKKIWLLSKKMNVIFQSRLTWVLCR